MKPRLLRVLLGHRRSFLAGVIGLASLGAWPAAWAGLTRGLLAWDTGALSFLVFMAVMFATARPDRMEHNAQAQQEGEWTLFWLVVAGATASFAAIFGEFGSLKNAPTAVKAFKIGLVAATLLLSWVLTHGVFALRYAHEFYSRTGASTVIDGGLEFPREPRPDYWDFFYFALVLGMTFQVSDVQITSRKFRRLATVHGCLGFLFNTVIVALTVNLASGLLG
jgi:uncharacterized membrane protein